ncbi:hypothetical protein PIB30_055661 [Stylosanthes scabra]|uniref:Myb-like domain-containing protein n=1 Tax=Stylosanthes scabra TaxID=79078 RepID=A0ABU6XJF2_9FABA|nr:hypothetical protein [Stylosanthes scabra]
MENPTLPENNRQAAAVAAEGDSVSSDGLKGEDGERNSSGANRWPREETMALIKIRSEMDGAFRDISPKAPLWEQVSRKLGELGYERSAKKCKEKFENIYKYHRRTKEGRSGKRNGKTYRFFDQLEALDPHPNPATPNNNAVIQDAVPFSVRFPVTAMEHSSSATSSYSSGSGGGDGEGEGEERRRKKRRRLRMFFEGLMREVLEKQESLQRKFMEVLDKCDQDRMAREQAWKTEELARIKKERELLAQERSIAAAKDEAVMSLIKKFAEKNNNVPLQFPAENNNLKEKEKEKEKDKEKEKEKEKDEVGNGINVGNFVHMSSSRWPKDEVEALIRLRTQLDEQLQQQGNNNGGPSKGPLWEEVSTAMKGLGYDRSAKRCKEKWENINKYFKRMKEKNKRKPEDSKTCPYYHHLEAIYSKKPRNNNKILDDDEDDMNNDNNKKNELKPEELLMHIMNGQEERQQDRDQDQDHSSSEDAERENTDQNHNGYQMVNNSPSSVAIMS